MKKQREPIRFVIVSRNNPEFQALAEELAKRQIPFKWYSGVYFTRSESQLILRILRRKKLPYDLIVKHTLDSSIKRNHLKRSTLIYTLEILLRVLKKYTHNKSLQIIDELISKKHIKKPEKLMRKFPLATFVLSNNALVPKNNKQDIVVLASMIHTLEIENIENRYGTAPVKNPKKRFVESKYTKAEDYAKLIVTNCEFSQNSYIRVKKPHQTIVNIPLAPVYSGSKSAKPLRKRDKEIRGLYLGRLNPNKGIIELIEASKQFPKDFILTICGSGDPNFVRKIQSLTSNLNIEMYISPSPEIILRELKKAEIIISNSFMEGFGITLLEGMSFGCIPVYTCNSFASQLLKGTPLGRFVIDPANPKTLLNAIAELYGLNEKQMNYLSDYSYKIAKEFTFDKYAKVLCKELLC